MFLKLLFLSVSQYEILIMALFIPSYSPPSQSYQNGQIFLSFLLRVFYFSILLPFLYFRPSCFYTRTYIQICLIPAIAFQYIFSQSFPQKMQNWSQSFTARKSLLSHHSGLLPIGVWLICFPASVQAHFQTILHMHQTDTLKMSVRPCPHMFIKAIL